MNYHHLTDCERYQIHAFLKAGWNQREIAKAPGRSESTISRELKRNTGKRGYRPKQAHGWACQRREVSAANAAVIPVDAWLTIEACLRDDWSPEQAAGETGLASTETIYQHVYQDKAAGGDLHCHLRCRKKRRKRYGSGRDKRGQIPNQTPISARPTIVDRRARLGDWEGDLVIGKGHSGALVTIAERRTQYILIRKVDSKEARPVRKAMTQMLTKVRGVGHTLTLDNGKEFAEHEKLADKTGITTYFADPYASWQRGLNEQINGLIRQYFPKDKRFDEITDEEVALVERKLNNRPRKKQGFKTPCQEIATLAEQLGVALRI